MLNIIKARGESNPTWPFMQLMEANGVISDEKLVNMVGDVYGSQHVILYGPTGEAILAASDTPNMDGQSPTAFNVTPVDGVAVAANANRRALVLVNDSDTNIYIGIGEAVAANNGVRLNAGGGTLVLSRWGPLFTTEDIHAIHGGAGAKVLTIQELF